MGPLLVDDPRSRRREGGAAAGAGPGQVVVCDSTSVNLYKLLVAALRLRPSRRRLLTVEGIFPTDRYLIAEVAAEHGVDVGGGARRSRPGRT